jgi:hypothetical protein
MFQIIGQQLGIGLELQHERNHQQGRIMFMQVGMEMFTKGITVAMSNKEIMDSGVVQEPGIGQTPNNR